MMPVIDIGDRAAVNRETEALRRWQDGLAEPPKVALLYSEQDAAVLKRKNVSGAIRPLPPAGL